MSKCCRYVYPNGQCCDCGTQTDRGLTEDKTMVSIIVNGRLYMFAEMGFISYEDICTLAGIDPAENPTVACVSSRRRDHTISAGDIGPVENGTVYNVANTGNA